MFELNLLHNTSSNPLVTCSLFNFISNTKILVSKRQISEAFLYSLQKRLKKESMRSKSTLFLSKICQRRFISKERRCIVERGKYVTSKHIQIRI